MCRPGLVFVIACSALAWTALAQEKTPEDRLRDALRQSVEQMRAAQDQAAQLQAQVAAAQHERDLAKAAQAADEQKVAATTSKPAAPPEERLAMQAQLRAAGSENAHLRAALTKMQMDNAQLAEMARGKAAEAAQSIAHRSADAHTLDACRAANARLVGVAEDILHMYQTFSFRALLLRSYEPVVGFARVKLENLVQDYDDRIHGQECVGPGGAAAVTR